MQIKREQLNLTTVKLTLTADKALLDDTKQAVLKRLGKNMKLSGFRPGHEPLTVVERNADSSVLQSEFLDEVLNRMYGAALEQEKLRPVAQPKVSIQKFVPFTDLEITAEVEVIGDVKLPDYKKIKLAKKAVAVTEKDIDDVVHSLQQRVAEKKEVTRAAKNGDEVIIDFAGRDAKTGDAIKGADGKSYPLTLDSDTFIPGFESNVTGMKPGEQKEFILVFPKDYGVKALQSRKVIFSVTLNKVQEVSLPKADDTFAGKIGPFKTLASLRDDIKKQLVSEKQSEADRAFENELLDKIADKTTVAIPAMLIDEEVNRAEQEVRQNLTYRGQTWQEYLDSIQQTEDAYRASLREPAERRVKAGLVLTEVAEQEGITVTSEEFQLRMQLLKGQYASDKQMQAELEKPENARSILSSMLTEKTIARLSEYCIQLHES